MAFRILLTSEDNEKLVIDGDNKTVAAAYSGYIIGDGFRKTINKIKHPIIVIDKEKDRQLTIPQLKDFTSLYLLTNETSQESLYLLEEGKVDNIAIVKQGCRYDLGIPPSFHGDEQLQNIDDKFIDIIVEVMKFFGSYNILVKILTYDESGELHVEEKRY